jgi:hypothetical protein
MPFSVDVDSHIRIDFDRDWIAHVSECFEAEILISAERLRRGEKATAIEVPGYSLIGEAKKPATAQIRSSTEALNLLEEWRTTSERIWTTITALVPKDTVKQYIWDPDSVVEIREEAAYTDRVTGEFYPAKIDSIPQGYPTVTRLVRDENTQRFLWPNAVLDIQARKNQWTATLDKLLEPSNQVFVKIIVEEADRDPGAILQLAKDLKTWMDALDSLDVKDDTNQEEAFRLIVYMDDAFFELQDLFKTIVPQRIQARFIQSLRDTTIIVAKWAEPGDVIELKVANGPDKPALNRELLLRLRVEDFGLTRNILDSFVFLKRLGVSESADEQMPSSTDDDQMPPSTGMEPSETEAPSEVNFEPAAGVTLLWTYRTRPQQSKLLEVLNPGVGMNVSFPRFGSKITSFTSPTDSTTARVTVESDRGSLQIAAGFVVSLFDNAIHFTYGWNLSAPEKRRYWGVGFSFLSVTKKVASAAGSK